MFFLCGGRLDNENKLRVGEWEGFGDFVLTFIDFSVLIGKYFHFVSILKSLINRSLDKSFFEC